MTTKALMIAISGCLRFTPVTTIGIASVGTAGAGGQLSPVACTLPAGCAMGDTVVLSCSLRGSGTLQWVAPAASIAVLPSTIVDAGFAVAVFARALTQADIDAGNVSVTYSSSSTLIAFVAASVYRGVDASMLDIAGTLATGSVGSGTAINATAPSIATTADGDMLQYVLFSNAASPPQTVTPPSGWTADSGTVTTGHMAQTAKGGTGDVAVSAEFGADQTGKSYAILLLALRKRDTTFRLTGTLPNGTVGTAWIGTLNLNGDFLAPVAVSGTPAWMGTPTVDTVAKTVTWSGTPDTAQGYAFTPVATDANLQVATGAEQTVTIAAASAVPVVVQQAVSLGTANGVASVTLGAAPVAGNTLLMIAASSNTVALSTPAGWTRIADTFVGATVGRRYIFQRIADGTEGTTISVTFGSGNSGFCVQEWRGSVTITPAEGGQTTAASGFSVGPFVAPASSAVPAVFAMFSGSSALPPWTWPVAWTTAGPLNNGSFPSRGQAVAYGQPTASAVAAVPVTYASTRGNGNTVLWVGVWVS